MAAEARNAAGLGPHPAARTRHAVCARPHTLDLPATATRVRRRPRYRAAQQRLRPADPHARPRAHTQLRMHSTGGADPGAWKAGRGQESRSASGSSEDGLRCSLAWSRPHLLHKIALSDQSQLIRFIHLPRAHLHMGALADSLTVNGGLRPRRLRIGPRRLPAVVRLGFCCCSLGAMALRQCCTLCLAELTTATTLSLCSVQFASVISLSGCSAPFRPCPISAVSPRHNCLHEC
ncbi:hypothetical protein POSPLADRAFT_1057669 [Postia placenta MAD-698-R-SB12]|uniref:Uncharacterized protein n=1 Tax=Postia placenta MAD-698-R-SB12 TaxID=670580 RepID=A0A1X6MZW6_9APHY|nr:hypothetical protein POSPLADRAFT_1057669 [Postia placenta MAD-698-R-SB12]OSX61895.1 hypothetical protein POSPLADRAFT_1057669 [Postia placenta MAD-698-R-SB12]